MPAREHDVIQYSEDDPGILTFSRKGMTEIHTVVKSNSQAYVKRGLEGRKIIILVLPEGENE
jgi:hypothetical protein